MSSALSVRDSDKSKPYIPLAGVATDGWSKEDEATATCFCGAVQLAFPTTAPGLVDSFVCNCTDRRKITGLMFTSAFVIDDKFLKHLRGQSQLKAFAQSSFIASHTLMTNYFCSTCGSLMYRIAARLPGHSILRLGTVDDFNLVETKLRPRTEVFMKDRVSWFPGVPGEEVKRYNARQA
ncbi:Mss4-like protein [Ampelomyces quisqualis]|uniref:Mss4-like protein n=1 Tax=Ampelomyces quisqualis TaxID=50730 RepID=A0A6A5QUR1_AMPQU|nr:Mss4-like protein [Ampelomyces quisqualis]